MTPEMKQELQRLREADDQLTFPKLLMVLLVTLAVAFSVIYIISGMNDVAI